MLSGGTILQAPALAGMLRLLSFAGEKPFIVDMESYAG